MDYIRQEIMDEPEALQATITKGMASYDRAARALLECGCNRIYAIGCGSSYFTGMLARYAIERYLRIPTIPLSAVDFHTYALDALDGKAAVLAISQSGESYETVEAAEVARNRAGLIVGLTNKAGSSLAKAASEVLLTDAGEERASGTKTVLAQMAACHLFALLAAERKGSHPPAEISRLLDELAQAPAIVRDLLHREGELDDLARFLGTVDHLCLVAAGPQFPLTMQVANTAREIAQVHVQAFDVVEFRHGPLEIVRPGTYVMFIGGTDGLLAGHLGRLARMCKEAGAVIMAATDADDRELIAQADRSLILPRLSDMAGAIVYLAAFHLLLYRWALVKGLDPNVFRNIVKTWVREPAQP